MTRPAEDQESTPGLGPRWRPRWLEVLDLAPFQPRLLQALKGYERRNFFADVGAGLTVGVVALPLAMAFAIASGVKPEAGLFTAIIAGFLISALGGSQVQIGGPAGAFIVIVYGIVERYGLANLLLCTALAGGLLFLMGLLKLGTLVRYIPVSIVIGFTNGIAVLIAISQFKDILGLSPPHMPGDVVGQIRTLWAYRGEFNPWALALSMGTFVGLFLWPRFIDGPRVLPEKISNLALIRFAARVPGPMIALLVRGRPRRCFNCRCRRLARALAASRRPSRRLLCPISAGRVCATCSFPRSRSHCWGRLNPCCAHGWQTTSPSSSGTIPIRS
jgi:SulP family sulfate permease